MKVAARSKVPGLARPVPVASDCRIVVGGGDRRPRGRRRHFGWRFRSLHWRSFAGLPPGVLPVQLDCRLQRGEGGRTSLADL